MTNLAGDEVSSGCLPENKLEYIDEYEKAGFPVCMIGDGINNAPALKKGLGWHCNGRRRLGYSRPVRGLCIDRLLHQRKKR